MKPKLLTVIQLDHWTVIELIQQHEAQEAGGHASDIITVDAKKWTIDECNDWLASFNPHEKPLTHYGDEIMRRVVRLRVHRPLGKVMFPTRFVVDPKTFGKAGADESGTTASRVNLYYFDVVDVYNLLHRKMPIGRGADFDSDKALALDFSKLLKQTLPIAFNTWPNGLRIVFRVAQEGQSKRKRITVVHEIEKADVLARNPIQYVERGAGTLEDDDGLWPSAKIRYAEDH